MTISSGAALAMPQGAELLIILLLVLLLFGAKRLPDAARGLGRSLRILKTETKGMHDEEVTDGTDQRAVEGSADAETTIDARDTAQPQPQPTAKDQ